MKKIRYVGPFDEVTISATGQVVQRNHQIEVEDDELARSLLEQEGVWEKVTAPKKESGNG